MTDESERERDDRPPTVRPPDGPQDLRDGTGTELGWTGVDRGIDLYRPAGFTDLFHSWAIHLPPRPSR